MFRCWPYCDLWIPNRSLADRCETFHAAGRIFYCKTPVVGRDIQSRAAHGSSGASKKNGAPPRGAVRAQTRRALQAGSPCIPSYPSAGSAAAGASLEIPKFTRCLPPPEGWRFPPPVPTLAAGGEPAGSEVERGVAGWVWVSVCLSVRALLCLRQPVQRRAPRGRAAAHPSAAHLLPSQPRSAHPGRPSIGPPPPAPSADRGANYQQGANCQQGVRASARPPGCALPAPAGPGCGGAAGAVPAVPAGRLCASGPRLAVPAGPAPSWLPGMNMHGPPSSSSSSCMCVCVCGERGSASSAAPAMSARLRLGPP